MHCPKCLVVQANSDLRKRVYSLKRSKKKPIILRRIIRTEDALRPNYEHERSLLVKEMGNELPHTPPINRPYLYYGGW